VQGARAGDRDAWTRLVQRFDRMLRRIARSYRLTPAEIDDVAQTTGTKIKPITLQASSSGGDEELWFSAQAGRCGLQPHDAERKQR
jgi:hypothetical protein